MRPVTLAVLAVIVALLAAFLWFVERDLPSSEERLEYERRLFRAEAGEVSALIIATPSQETAIESESQSGEAGWRLVRPLSARADGAKVEALIGSLTALEKKRTLDAVAPGSVGLEQPRLTVKISTPGGNEVLRIGSDVPASEAVIVGVEDGGVFVVSNAFMESLDVRPDAWRARDVVPFARYQISGLSLKSGAGEVTVMRRAGRFMLESPVLDDASEEKVSELLDALDQLEVVEFVETPASKVDLGLEVPTAVVSLDIEGRTDPLVIRFGRLEEETGNRFAATSEGMFSVRTEIPNLLRNAPETWQSAQWTTIDTFAVDQLSVEGPEGKFILIEDSGQWRRNDVVVADALVDDLLEDIVGLEGIPLEAVLEDDLESLAGLELAAGERVEVLEVLQKGSGYIATREGRAFPLAVEESAASELLAAIRAVELAEPEPGSPESGST